MRPKKRTSVAEVYGWPSQELENEKPVKLEVAQAQNPSLLRSKVEDGLQPAKQLVGTPAKNILERMQKFHVPNVSVTVIAGGEIVWSRDYDSSAQTSVPTPDEPLAAPVFRAGSISKTVNAVFAMKLLVETGVIGINENLSQRLSDMGISNTTGKPITLAQLLSHTAGISVHGFPGYRTNIEKLPTTEEILRGSLEVKNAPPDVITRDLYTPNNAPVKVMPECTPGEQYRYSGGGTMIIQRLIELEIQRLIKLGDCKPGETYASLAKKLIFDLLEMANSTFEIIRPESASANVQKGHDREGKVVETAWRLHPESAAAGLWTSSKDLAKFVIAIQNAYLGIENSLLKKETAQQMLTRQPNSKDGLGCKVRGEGDSLSFFHEGSTAGYRAEYICFPNPRIGAVVLSNSFNADYLKSEVLSSIANAYAWPERQTTFVSTTPLSHETLDRCSGEFVASAGGGREISIVSKIQDGQLTLSLPNFKGKEREVLTFVPLSGREFFCVEHQFKVTFSEEYSGMTFVDGLHFMKFADDIYPRRTITLALEQGITRDAASRTVLSHGGGFISQATVSVQSAANGQKPTDFGSDEEITKGSRRHD